MDKKLHPAIKILEKYKKLVWPEINKYLKDPLFPKAFSITEIYKKDLEFHWKIVREYPERKGKYLRPTLLTLAAQAMGTNLRKALKTAAAMQVSEEWILIHDDVEDQSLLRRGKPTLNEICGNWLALNAGDTLHAIMWKILIDNLPVLKKSLTKKIINEFHKIIMRTTLGQATEIHWTENNKIDFTVNDWCFIADSKVSYYTIAAPMRLGAIIAGTSKKQLERLAKFGVYLGRSFQLIDDILDITSDFSGLKQKGSDIYEGKRTVLLGHLLKNANRKDKNRLKKILGKIRKRKTENEINWVINKMKSYGSIDYAKDLAKKYKEKAVAIFEKDLRFLSKQPYRNELKQIIDFIVEREY
jgi:geranylgeranyl diphosphate synthase type II